MLILQKTAFSILLLFLLLSRGVLAQTSAVTDSLFMQAQKLAFSGEYTDSRQLCRQILKKMPEHSDAAILMGRTYAWQEEFDSARMVLSPLVHGMAPPVDAFVALSAVELWAGFPEIALEHSGKGLDQEPGSAPLLLSKARALRDLKRFEAAREVLEVVIQADPGDKEAERMARQLKVPDRNRIKFLYQISAFDTDLSPWYLGTLEYQRDFINGKYLLRLNHAEQYTQQSMQAEVDAYPSLGKKTYAYLNAGVSDKKLFPGYRGGAELYHGFPASTEASLGVRILYFTEETVVLYTGHIGRYFSKYWVSFRPFLHQKDDNWQATAVVQLRQYLKQEESFVGILLAKGSTPFVPVGIQEMVRLDASRISFEGRFRVGDKYLAGGILTYELEEMRQDIFRHRFTGAISIQRKF